VQSRLEHVEFSDDRVTAKFSLEIKPPLSYNNSKGHKCCECELMFSQDRSVPQPLQCLPRDGIVSFNGNQKVLATIIGKLPPNRPEKMNVDVHALVRYSGKYSVPSNGITITIPESCK